MIVMSCPKMQNRGSMGLGKEDNKLHFGHVGFQVSEGHVRGVSGQWTWIHESGIQVKHS